MNTHNGSPGESSLNRLQFEQSPYLQQHATNPVDWYPWGEEAFARAAKEDKPVFLSIGYSSCHWCHVMEAESFEHQEVAHLMNDVFINIKVDREERPDIDELYMSVAQMMLGNGGWPLNVLLTPDKKPFLALTYIPRESRGGRTGMVELIPKVAETWRNRRADVNATSESVLKSLRQIAARRPEGEAIGESIHDRAAQSFHDTFDEENGGFGSRPKFPSAHNLMYLLRHWRRTGDSRSLYVVERTLYRMRQGGIFDHIGFGFHRYSTTADWKLPHFEKMLYDQAMLALVYTEAYQATGNRLYAQTVEEILSYVTRDLLLTDGVFASAEDADSEGKEGLFYLWSAADLEAVSAEVSGDMSMFPITQGGNYLDEATGTRTGLNILYRTDGIEPQNDADSATPFCLEPVSEDLRQRLLQVRSRRTRPFRDEKVLTSWNGLIIAALSKAAGALDNNHFLESARKAADRILDTMVTDTGRLMHSFRGTVSGIPGYSTDYAFFIWGLIELYEATFEEEYLIQAIELSKRLVTDFWDSDAGGFHLTAYDSEALLVRPRIDADGALPSANSVSALNFLRLGRMMQDDEYERRETQIITSISPLVEQYPTAFSFLRLAADFAATPTKEVVLAGSREDMQLQSMACALRREFSPNAVYLFNPEDKANSRVSEVAPYLRFNTSLDGLATAYICLNYACKRPVTEVESMLELLRESTPENLY